MNIAKHLFQSLFLSELTATPEGRAWILNQAAHAEDSDEGRLFDVLLARIEDPELARMVKRHQVDEKRHAAQFRECLERTGFATTPVPEDVQIIDRLDKALGGFFDRFGRGEVAVMEVYVLLQVIEERAVTQFGILESHMRVHDPDTADVIARVISDEHRHLRYCRAVATRYAPDEETLARTLEEYRRVEAAAFAENSMANMRHAFERGLIGRGTPFRRLAWWALGRAAARRSEPEFTAFAGLRAAVA